MNDNICQLNDYLKELKKEYSKNITSQSKRIMFLLDEKNFIPHFAIETDTNILDKIFKVLLNNAIQYTDKGYIKVGYHVLEDDTLQFYVEDTGLGFDSAVLETLTQQLASDNEFNTKEESLSAVNKLIKAKGGKIRIESQQGMGATVYFNIEFNSVANSSPEEIQAEASLKTRKEASQDKANTMNDIWKGKTILIAEDEIVNFMFLEVLFEETGAKLIHATDGRQAIDAVKANPDINIVLMDIKMPNVNGLEATKLIKAMRPQLPIIAQTAYAMQDDEYKALQAGCNDYISKPIDANKLISLMKKYLW